MIDEMIVRYGIDELVARTDKAHTGQMDKTTVQRAIDDACDFAKSYIALDNLTDASVLAICDIARYYLYDDKIPQAVEARHKQAISYLERVGNQSKGRGGFVVIPNTVPTIYQ